MVSKIKVEVEVPEGVDPVLARRFLERQARKLKILMDLAEAPGRSGELSPGEESLLREIKRGVARRAGERVGL